MLATRQSRCWFYQSRACEKCNSVCPDAKPYMLNNSILPAEVDELSKKTEKHERPQVTGTVQLNRKNVGTIALWIQPKAEGAKTPDLKGQLKDVDEKTGKTKTDSAPMGYVSLWLNGYKLVPA